MGLHFSFWLTGSVLLENGMVGVEGYQAALHSDGPVLLPAR